MDNFGLTQLKVAEIFKCGQPRVSGMVKTSSDLTDKQFKALSDIYGEEVVLSYRINDINDHGRQESCNLSMIPLLPISAQAGTLNEFIVTVKNNECERVISPIMGADYAITVAGDSMSPDFPCGSQVLIKKIDESVFIHWGSVFVLDTRNGVIVKKILPIQGDDDSILCESINPKYPPFKVKTKDIFGFYRVMMCMTIK